MWLIYVDESVIERRGIGNSWLLLLGLLVPAEKAKALETEVMTIARQHLGSMVDEPEFELKAQHIHGACGKFKGFPRSLLDQMLSDLISLLARYDCKTIVVALPKASPPPSYMEEEPYRLAFEFFVNAAELWLLRSRVHGVLFLDEGGFDSGMLKKDFMDFKTGKKHLRAYKIPMTGKSSIIGGLCTVNSKEHVLLQLSDLACFTTARSHRLMMQIADRHKQEGRDLNELFYEDFMLKAKDHEIRDVSRADGICVAAGVCVANYIGYALEE